MKESDFVNELGTLIDAGIPGIQVQSLELLRAIRLVEEVAEKRYYQVYHWTPFLNIHPSPLQQMNDMDGIEVNTFSEAIEKFTEYLDAATSDTIVTFSAFGDENWTKDVAIAEGLERIIDVADRKGHVVILFNTDSALPPACSVSFRLVTLDLPDEEAVKSEFAWLIDQHEKNTKDGELSPIEFTVDPESNKQALGLSYRQIEDAALESKVRFNEVKPDTFKAMKRQVVEQTGLLEFMDTDKLPDVGGLDALKTWTQVRKIVMDNLDKAIMFGVDLPKGVLLVGISGTGKSLSAKQMAKIFSIPLIRLDMGKIFGKFVGQSEHQMEQAIATINSAAPAVLWIDEIEKAFAGQKSSSASDSGVTSRVIGIFLTWLQEKTSAIFVVATANDISQLPPELLRKGRFDEMFFVDLPDEIEREEIWTIHLTRKNVGGISTKDMKKLVEATEGYTGAEIEQIVKDAMNVAFSENQDDPVVELHHLLEATAVTRPLSVTMSDQIGIMRDWASKHSRYANSRLEESKIVVSKPSKVVKAVARKKISI